MSGFGTFLQRAMRSVRRQGALRAIAAVSREKLFPRGSARDRFWAKRMRPIMRWASGWTPPPPPPPTDISRWTSPAERLGGPATAAILVVKLDHIGDFLLALPALALLRRNFPEHRIDLLCATWNADLAKRTGLFNDVHPYDFFNNKSDSQQRHRAGASGIAALGLPPYDIAIDLRVDPDTRAVLGLVHARCKAGYRSDLMPPDMSIELPQPGDAYADEDGIFPHQRNLMLALVAAVIACFDPLHDTGRLIGRMIADETDPPDALRRDWRRPVIAVNTASGRQIKNWPIERFAEICRWMVEALGATVVLLGSGDQAAEAAAIATEIGDAALVDLVGTLSLAQSLAVVRRADLFLGNDSALTHAAAALDVPVVAIFSGIDPIAMWGPLGPHVTALRVPVTCSPCHLSYVTDCRHDRACVMRIDVETVKRAICVRLAPAPVLRAAAGHV